MKKDIRIASNIALPMDAVTMTQAILAMKGSGKTHTAVVFAEELLAAEQHVVVVDPLDVWWGLRASKDGKSAGFRIVVLGGEHGDVPLDAGAGAVVAQFIIRTKASVVLSLRHMSMSEQRKFVTDFAERLYQLKGPQAERTPLHLILDEADEFCPQRIPPGGERLFGAIDRIVRRGRSAGFGVTMISQRAAVVNKDVLTQIDTLVALRTVSPQDRAALKSWVEANDHANQQATFMQSLASLKRGEGWVWSPGLNIFARANIRDRTTYDSSFTPPVGRRVEAPVIAKVDLAELTRDMQESIEKAKADDPAELRRQIAALKKQIGSAAAVDPKAIEIARAVGFAAGVDSLQDNIKRMSACLVAVRAALDQFPLPASTTTPDMKAAAQAAMKAESERLSEAQRRSLSHAAAKGAPVARAMLEQGSSLPRPQQRILDALAWLDSIGNRGPTRNVVAFLADASPRSSAFANNVSALSSRGLINYPAAGVLEITQAGAKLANKPAAPLSSEELQEMIYSKLPRPQAAILRALIDVYPNQLTRPGLAAAAGASAGSSAFANNVSALRSLGVIDYPSSGMTVASNMVFL